MPSTAERLKELEELYTKLYPDRKGFEELVRTMDRHAEERKASLRALDEKRRSTPLWYLTSDMVGETMYTELFNVSFEGLRGKVDHIKGMGVRYLHLMPFLKMPKGDNDGGFAVSDFMHVDGKFGSDKDLENLADTLRENGISLCMDFVMNHSADSHEWAIRAKKGEKEYQDMYFCYPDRSYPDEYEKTVPEVFPESAPGNFTWSEEMGKWVLTSFYPYQWDLNYANPKVFNAIAEAMLRWANMGVEVFRLDAVPYIWKKLGTNSRNLPEVHTIVRMIRLILEEVAPSVILKGEVVMAPKELAAYFGTAERPECHLLYGVSTMVNLWGALASEDVRLLESQVEALLALPPHCNFVNYIRCHDDIGWGFDEQKEHELGIDPLKHKIFMYSFFCGCYPSSYARGELYNYDERSLDARSCGTTASLVGCESAFENGIEARMDSAKRRFFLLYSAVYALRGFPLINSGDEIGQLNDYTYKNDPDKKDDQRYLHRSRFDWKKAELKDEKGTYQNFFYSTLRMLADIRRSHGDVFSPEASVSTWHTHNPHVFAIRRRNKGKDMLIVFNFSHEAQNAQFDYFEGSYRDILTGRSQEPGLNVTLGDWQVRFLEKI